jgi:hypothetical protein
MLVELPGYKASFANAYFPRAILPSTSCVIGLPAGVKHLPQTHAFRVFRAFRELISPFNGAHADQAACK